MGTCDFSNFVTMVSPRLLRKTCFPLFGIVLLMWAIHAALQSGTINTAILGPLQQDSNSNGDGGDTIKRPGFSGGARHVQELTDDYEEVEYSSSVQEKADVDAILQKPWTFNKSAAEEARLSLNENPDEQLEAMGNGREGEYRCKKVILDLPDRYSKRREGLTSAFQNAFSSKEMFSYFNPYKIITMTSDDATVGQLQRFYHSKAIPMVDVPPGISRLLPKKQLFRNTRYETCALVGNGGILLNSSCGESIDEKDFVIRCNFAEMEGFSADVGTKTNVLTFNPSILNRKFSKLKSSAMRTKFLKRIQSYGKYVLWVPVFTPHFLPIDVRTVLTFYEKNSNYLKDVQLAFPGNVLPEILDFWMSKGVDEERISTGLLMYIIASTICDKIHLYGFYPFPEYNNKPIPYHYEDPVNKSMTTSEFNSNFRRFHRLPDEFVYLKKMHSAGALQLNIGTCER